MEYHLGTVLICSLTKLATSVKSAESQVPHLHAGEMSYFFLLYHVCRQLAAASKQSSCVAYFCTINYCHYGNSVVEAPKRRRQESFKVHNL